MKRKFSLYKNTGIKCIKWQEYAKAINVFQEMLDFAIEKRHRYAEGIAHIGLGQVYRCEKKNRLAKAHYFKSLFICLDLASNKQRQKDVFLIENALKSLSKSFYEDFLATANGESCYLETVRDGLELCTIFLVVPRDEFDVKGLKNCLLTYAKSCKKKSYKASNKKNYSLAMAHALKAHAIFLLTKESEGKEIREMKGLLSGISTAWKGSDGSEPDDFFLELVTSYLNFCDFYENFSRERDEKTKKVQASLSGVLLAMAHHLNVCAINEIPCLNRPPIKIVRNLGVAGSYKKVGEACLEAAKATPIWLLPMLLFLSVVFYNRYFLVKVLTNTAKDLRIAKDRYL